MRLTEISCTGIDYWTFKFLDFSSPPENTYSKEPTEVNKIGNYHINEIRLCTYTSGLYYALYMVKVCAAEENGITN